jgi:hypothetical protein
MLQRLLFLILFTPITLFSQNNYGYLAGARSAGMAHATAALPHGFSTHHNQAALAFAEEPTLAASYQQRYGLANLNLSQLGFSSPLANGHFGVALNHFGFSDFNETKIGLAYAQKLAPYLAFGLQLNYEQNYVAEAQNFNTLSFEAGLLAQVTKKLNLAFHIYNPNGAYLNRATNLRLPTQATFGAAYSFSKKALWLAQVNLENTFRPRYSTGYEYKLLPFMALRTGLAVADDYEACFGLSYYFKDWELDLAYQYGLLLGPNVTVSLQWAF